LSAGLVAVLIGVPCWFLAAASAIDPHGPHPAWEEPLLLLGAAMGFIIGPALLAVGLIWLAVRFVKRNKEARASR
jgi:hypothetical protein